MTDNYTIAYPSLNLLKEWNQKCGDAHFTPYGYTKFIAKKAVEWTREQLSAATKAELQKARDEELDACCEWLEDHVSNLIIDMLRAARRPKPPSLKEQAKFAAAVLGSPDENCSIAELQQHWHTICCALEQLDD